MKKILILIAAVTLLSSCTENQRARMYGGSQEFTLPANHVLVTMTWKDTDLWILTKDTLTGISYFREKSTWGILEGSITVKPESK